MLQHWLIELVGHVSGLTDAQLKQVEKSLPATKGLIDLLNKAGPIIEQAQNLYVEAEPLIEQLRGSGRPRARGADFDRCDFTSCQSR